VYIFVVQYWPTLLLYRAVHDFSASCFFVNYWSLSVIDYDSDYISKCHHGPGEETGWCWWKTCASALNSAVCYCDCQHQMTCHSQVLD